MKNIFQKVKKVFSSGVIGLLSLVFTNEAKAQYAVPMPMYGVFRPTPEEILSRLLPFIGGIFVVFVVAPVVGLIWYRKRGGTKKWPKVVVWALAILFVIALVLLIKFFFILPYLKL